MLVDISPEWRTPLRVLVPLLHKLVDAYQVRFILCMANDDKNMKIAGQHKLCSSIVDFILKLNYI
jgi:putative thioredoxin